MGRFDVALVNAIRRLGGVAMMLAFAGCGLFGSGSGEVAQSQPGRTVYRAADQGDGGDIPEVPPSQKVPGETR